MLKLAHCKGEKIEIEGCALIRVGKIEDGKVRIDVTAPFTKAQRAEQAHNGVDPEQCVIVKLVSVHERDEGQTKATIGIHAPNGGVARRAEVANQQTPVHKQFPWKRYSPTARFWRSVDEEIFIPIPSE